MARTRAYLPVGRHGVLQLIMKWYVYQLINSQLKYRYIGIAANIEKRLIKHNQGSTRSTRPYRPFDKIEIIKNCESRLEARKWEIYYKSGCGREKLTESSSDG